MNLLSKTKLTLCLQITEKKLGLKSWENWEVEQVQEFFIIPFCGSPVNGFVRRIAAGTIVFVKESKSYNHMPMNNEELE